jgi:8-oxo-dGTP diphosphatase
MTEAAPAIAAAVVVHDGKLLLVRRRVAEGALSWQFPAGAVEQGETFEEAAVREAAEEAGLNVQAVQVLGERVHPSTGRLLGYVACDVVSGEAYVTTKVG